MKLLPKPKFLRNKINPYSYQNKIMNLLLVVKRLTNQQLKAAKTIIHPIKDLSECFQKLLPQKKAFPKFAPSKNTFEKNFFEKIAL